MTPAEADAIRIRAIPDRVTLSWLNEFGYIHPDVVTGLARAYDERGSRLARELEQHGRRMADRATMERGKTFITGRAGVIR